MLTKVVSDIYVAKFYEDVDQYIEFDSKEERKKIYELTSQKICPGHFYSNDKDRLLRRTVLLLQANPTDASKWSTYVQEKFVEALDKCFYFSDQEAVEAFREACAI
jgi:hypothetical protein